MPTAPWTLARRAERLEPSVIREILKVTEKPGIISLAGGLPAPESFPVQAMREACERVLADTPHEALQYAASEGFGPLREWVAAQLGAQGLRVRADQVLITTGSQQGLDLVGKVLIDPGSVVAVESPTYLGALQAFAPYEASFTAVAGDDDGRNVSGVHHLEDDASNVSLLSSAHPTVGRERLVQPVEEHDHRRRLALLEHLHRDEHAALVAARACPDVHAVVVEVDRLAVDGLVPDDRAAEGLRQGLVAQADAQRRYPGLGEAPDGLERDARLVGRAGAGRDDHAVGAALEELVDGGGVVAHDVDLRAELPQVLHEVVGEGVVVVDHQDARHGHCSWAIASSIAFSTARDLFTDSSNS